MQQKLSEIPVSVLKTMPRNEWGEVVVDEYESADGTTVRCVWDEFEGYRVELFHDDPEYLKARMRNLLPDVPVIHVREH